MTAELSFAESTAVIAALDETSTERVRPSTLAGEAPGVGKFGHWNEELHASRYASCER